jgi:hypothetical protein
MVRALRAVSSAMRTLARLAIDTCVGCAAPASLSTPSRHAISRPCVSDVAMSTSFCCVSWKEPTGRSKTVRDRLYSSAAS